MLRKFLRTWPLAVALALAACSGSPETMLSPSAVVSEATFLNADGSTIKVGAPGILDPTNNATVDSQRPTLRYSNPAGRFARVGWSYDVELHDAARVIYTREALGEGSGTSSHTVEVDLDYSRTYWWRVRVRLGDQVGPWSDFAQFQTPPPPAPPAPAAGTLSWVVPDVCSTGSGPACSAALAATSPWWAACRAGSGTNCHRFTRQLAASLAVFDPNWGLITKNPGEQQCSWDGCGPGNGSGYGEDVVAYSTGGGNWIGWDVVVGAGAPGAGLNWAQLSSRRPGNNWAPVPPFP